MKKLLLSIGAGTFALSAFAQLPVSTTPSKKKVVLEEFTGLYCGHCPDGHKIGNTLKASKNAGDIILVNIHTGGYANVNPAEPNDLDLRTTEGAAILNIQGMNVSGYPTGSVNRRIFGNSSGFAMSRSAWGNSANTVLNEDSYANIAVEGIADESTRELTINVELYYTESTTNTNNLTVMVLEDSLLGNQDDYMNYYPEMVNNDGLYMHMHALRKVVTDATGELIPTSETVQGQKVTRTYKWTVPEDLLNTKPNLANLSVVAFIAEGESNIITGAESNVRIGATSTRNLLDANNVSLYPNPALNNLNVTIENQNSKSAIIEIYDMLGKRVMTEKHNLSHGNNHVNLNISNLNTGIYNVNIITDQGAITKKLTIAN